MKKISNYLILVLLALLGILIINSCSEHDAFEENLLLEESKLETNKKRELKGKFHEIKIVTQNVGWLKDSAPATNFRGQNLRMSRFLASQGADIIVLQEVFDGTTFDTFIRDFNQRTNNKYYSSKKNNAVSGKIGGGHGIIILSKFRIFTEKHNYYYTCNGDAFGGGGDCLAKKGFLHANLILSEGNQLQVIGTHLDAGDGLQDIGARRTQIVQLRSYLESINHSKPLVIAGDMNTADGTFDYEEMLERLQVYPSFNNFNSPNSAVNDQTHTNGDNTAILDYILLARDFLTETTPHHYPRHYTVDRSVINNLISDHAMVSSKITYDFPTPISTPVITKCSKVPWQNGYYHCEHSGNDGEFEWMLNNGTKLGTGTTSWSFKCNSGLKIQLHERRTNKEVDSKWCGHF